MQGIKSTSVVYDDCEPVRTEPFALFCAEDSNGCHLEVRQDSLPLYIRVTEVIASTQNQGSPTGV